jgi:hypothetical protein
MTASRISSGQSKGHKTSAPKIVLNTGRFDYDCSVDMNVTYIYNDKTIREINQSKHILVCFLKISHNFIKFS